MFRKSLQIQAGFVGPEEVPKLDRDQIVVRSFVGGLVKSFERKAA